MRAPRGAPPVLVVAGTASGVGKTTVTLGLLEAFRRRGLTVQAFKVGPDFIDPGLHEIVTGRPSYNLDGWMCGRDHVLATVARHATGADLALVEGVMGCFDGRDPAGDEGSTAQVARWLGAPVVLVIDAGGQATSAAAVVSGFERFDPGVRVAAVIANRVGGTGHARWIAEAVRARCRALPVGALPRDDGIALPERHLGLVTAAEGPLTAARLRRLGDLVEAHVDLDALLSLADRPREAAAVEPSAPPPAPRTRIGVARDAAFQFYYAENLDRLRAAGAELVFWSPLADRVPEVDGLYFGGGYPELHGRRLAAGAETRARVRALAASGVPVLAECGGLMYLAGAIEDPEGAVHPMVGLLPATARARSGGLTLAYTEVRFDADTPLGPAGTVARGHEFHAWSLDPVPDSVPRAWRLSSGGVERPEGYLVGQALLSWVHLHFGSNAALAPAFVAACAGER